jgi:hypothetical protein
MYDLLRHSSPRYGATRVGAFTSSRSAYAGATLVVDIGKDAIDL